MCACVRVCGSKLTFLCVQVHLLSYLHGRDDHQVCCQGVHHEQVHVPPKPLELAGLRGHHQWVRHHRDGGGQLSGSANIQGPSSVKDCLHHAG